MNDLLRLGACALTAVVLLAAALAWMPAQARDRTPTDVEAAGDLHGLASLTLPRSYRALGLAGADRALSPAEQLARHDDGQPLVFRFTRDPSNDWGGHARDPELLNVVLLPPAALAEPDRALRRFSIDRYVAPTGATVPLDSPRWQAGGDGRLRWRVLAMDDHFGTDHAPRWAVAMLDEARGVRLDLFVWQRRMTQADALAWLRGLLDGLQVRPALAAHWAQAARPGGQQARLARLREANLQAMFDALAPLGLRPPAPGDTAFAPGVATWLDDDRGAVRVLRVLASVPRDGVPVDGRGWPRLPIVMTPGQYPGPTVGGTVPALDLQILYWHAGLGRWQRSGLQRPTMQEEHPLLPFEQAVAARLERTPGARDAVHVVIGEHWFHPPALDDTRRVGRLLAEAARWQAELLAGRIVGGDVKPAMLR